MNTFSPPNNNHYLRFLGLALNSFAIATIIYQYTPLYRLNYQARLQNPWLTPTQAAEESPLPPLSDSTAGAIIEEAASFGVNSYFSIVIPKLNAYSDIIANVDPFNQEEYKQALLEGIAHAKGTSFPGLSGTTYLFAHSTDSALNITRYNAVFYELRTLEIGDRIIVFFQDQKFEYQVTQKQVVSASDTSWLSRATTPRLILQTCDPPGTTLRRLLIIAQPIS